MNPLKPRLPSFAHSLAFTIGELMVTVAVIGIVSAVVINTSQASWRREQASTATVDLSSWLEEISKSPDLNGTPCQVDVNTGTLNPGGVLASVTPTTCARESNLRLPEINVRSTFQVAVTGALASGASRRWWFTPRGSITTTSAAATSTSSAADISVRISVAGNVPVRCVRLSGTLGLIRLGRNNATGNTATDCNEWSVR